MRSGSCWPGPQSLEKPQAHQRRCSRTQHIHPLRISSYMLSTAYQASLPLLPAEARSAVRRMARHAHPRTGQSRPVCLHHPQAAAPDLQVPPPRTRPALQVRLAGAQADVPGDLLGFISHSWSRPLRAELRRSPQFPSPCPCHRKPRSLVLRRQL